MKSISRRGYLSLLAMSLVGAGCLGSESKPLGLREVELINLSNEAKEISVSITKESEKVYNETHTVPPAPNQSKHLIVDPELGDRADYTVTVSTEIDGETVSTSSGSDSFSGDFGQNTCFKAVAIVEMGELNIAHTYFESCQKNRSATTGRQ